MTRWMSMGAFFVAMAAVPAAATAADKTYKGALEGGGKFTQVVAYSGGKPDEIISTKFQKADADCEDPGSTRINEKIKYAGQLSVEGDGQFFISFDDPGDDPDVFNAGEFRRNNRKVVGEFGATVVIDRGSPGEQHCTVPEQDYRAERA